MDSHTDDKQLLSHIGRLVAEEERLLAQDKRSEHDHHRVSEIGVELDQSWDLLRRRRALREFGDDPAKAELQSPLTVENYKP